MDQYLTFVGSNALSGFRKEAFASELGVGEVKAQYVHYVALNRLEHGQQDDHHLRGVLQELLNYGDDASDDVSEEGREFDTYFVLPRSGTISPWSSKATSIAHTCGLGNAVRRIERGITIQIASTHGYDKQLASNILHDRMTQTFDHNTPDLDLMFAQGIPTPSETVPVHAKGVNPREALRHANKTLGLALGEPEIEFLVEAYSIDGPIARDPTETELFMWAQINSEHCRHKQFNASWSVDGVQKQYSLFDMIRNTYECNPNFVISAYTDNACVFEGHQGVFLAPDRYTGEWKRIPEMVPYTGKVETHNHPTSISPYEGAATGSGGEIRDEGSVGRGSRCKAGLCGFAVSDLLISSMQQPWEQDVGYPSHIATSLKIMLEAPIGSADYNNEYGRPSLGGFFRTLLTKIPLGNDEEEIRGFHKPIMLAGGIGTIRPQHALKDASLVPPGAWIVVMGGPALKIGMGGGAASSQASAEDAAELDFASVQRGNAEVQRRAQEVIDSCASLGVNNPILFIHDVGAGGLSNGLTELLQDTDLGATIELRDIENADRSMTAMQIWCNEAQERYVLAIDPVGLDAFQRFADRERCSYSIVARGERRRDAEHRLVLTDKETKERPIDLPMTVLFGKVPKLSRAVESRRLNLPEFDTSLTTYLPNLKSSFLEEAVSRVLQFPCVASKMFLITIGDRTVGGLTCRDQLVSRWQTPVADCCVTATSLNVLRTGEAMALGEKPAIALISPVASARMAVAESLLNLASSEMSDGLRRVRMSCNWMTAINAPGEAAAIYDAVEAVGMQLCPELGVSIPVGKDSTSMKMSWTEPTSREVKEVTSPLSLVVTAFTAVKDTRRTWTPALQKSSEVGETILVKVDLAEGSKAMGASALSQVFGQIGNDPVDLRSVQLLKDYFDAIEQLHQARIVLAYHDISDGGLFTTLVEMAVAGRTGINVMLDGICNSTDTADVIACLFNEELGAVFQIRKSDEINFRRCFATCGPPSGLIEKIAQVSPSNASHPYDIAIYHGMSLVYRSPLTKLHQTWSRTSYEMCKLRGNPACADAEYSSILDTQDPGISYNLTFKPAESILPTTTKVSTYLSLSAKPRVAIIREQGTNGQREMAIALMSAGFAAIDVHMSDLISGRESLENFRGAAFCGGFSYGDVLGAGQGWSKSILYSKGLRRQFVEFFARKDTFSLGVCNGCQLLTRLKSLIPGADAWPSFQRNISEQYEARFCMVEILDDAKEPSIFLHGMNGTTMPIAVSHGEGRAHFLNASSQTAAAETLLKSNLVPIRYVDNYLRPTESYPANPNGSPCGIAGLRSVDGRVLAMMPHPERCVLNPGSWFPLHTQEEWGDYGPWVRIFQSARRWVG